MNFPDGVRPPTQSAALESAALESTILESVTTDVALKNDQRISQIVKHVNHFVLFIVDGTQFAAAVNQ